jgi:hypothetical protein
MLIIINKPCAFIPKNAIKLKLAGQFSPGKIKIKNYSSLITLGFNL